MSSQINNMMILALTVYYFDRNIGVELGGAVDKNMVSTLSHIASIGLKYFLLLDKVESVPY